MKFPRICLRESIHKWAAPPASSLHQPHVADLRNTTNRLGLQRPATRHVKARLFLLVGVWITQNCFAADNPAPPILQIDAGKVKARVGPLDTGLFTEEVNHSYDGGLYAEMISNRLFQDPGNFFGVPVVGLPDYNLPPHWSSIQAGSSAVAIRVDDQQPLNSSISSTLRVDVISASAGNRGGVANDGFWGIAVKPGTNYRVSFLAKGNGSFTGPLVVSLENSDDGSVLTSAIITLSPDTGWHHYQVILTTSADIAPSEHNRFLLTTEKPCTLWLSVVSLFPPTYHGRPNGNRVDLMEKLAALKPTFLRFPGGNYLQGETVDTRFDWKKTVGDVAGRPTLFGYWKYPSSNGLGLLEFFEWCEDLGVEPILSIYSGLSAKEPAVAAGARLAPFVRDAVDEIEYVTGGSETKWGAMRAKDGHPRPFKLSYVEVGNEDWDIKSNYEGRFAQFYDGIKARYPQLHLIATASVKSRRPDVIDEHYYRTAMEVFQDSHHFDRYDRNGPKIFVGEWASFGRTPVGVDEPTMAFMTLESALGDAAWMTDMERNADIVIMQSYGGLLANVNKGAYQGSGLIGYDALHSFGTPSYYAQEMFNSHRGDEVLESSPGVAPDFFSSVTRDSEKDIIYIKAVNASGVPQTVRIETDGAPSIKPEGKELVLSGKPDDINSLMEPARIVPVESALTGASAAFVHAFPAYSVTVLELRIQ
jgi:alpha-L-arabinofuranosidase